MLGEDSLLASSVPRELYQWSLLTYGVTSLGRMSAEGYKQIVILRAAWYDVPTAAFATLEHGFIQQVLLSLAFAEVINMVLGALIKEKARQEGRDERDRAWREWLRRKAEAERKDEPFDEPSPDEQPEAPRRRFLLWQR